MEAVDTLETSVPTHVINDTRLSLTVSKYYNLYKEAESKIRA